MALTEADGHLKHIGDLCLLSLRYSLQRPLEDVFEVLKVLRLVRASRTAGGPVGTGRARGTPGPGPDRDCCWGVREACRPPSGGFPRAAQRLRPGAA